MTRIEIPAALRAAAVFRATILVCIILATLFSLAAAQAIAEAPQVLHTPGYESPVRGDPDDLLMIAGSGFQATDRVVYQKAESPDNPREHPTAAPAQSTSDLGTAPVVQIGSPPYSLTVRLPTQMQTRQIYRLWVVNAANEWSAGMTINDPRPMWITPSYADESADVAGTQRRVRVVGRNLEPDEGMPLQIRLRGPKTYVLTALSVDEESLRTQHYVAESALPEHLAPGAYTVGVSRNGHDWVEVPAQYFEIRPDPADLQRFAVTDPRFGTCRPDDGVYDNACFARAIDAAARQGGGVVFVPAGTWDLDAAAAFTLPRNVHLLGSPDRGTVLQRHDAKQTRPPGPLLTLTRDNSVVGLTFTDTDHYDSRAQSRAVIQLGVRGGNPAAVSDIVISGNAFHHVGRAIIDGGHPIVRLFITHNEFAAFDEALALPGDRFNVTELFRIDDSVIRWNRFVPGSYLDLKQSQGTMASELGAAARVDFSSNVADGASTAGLQDPTDPKGFRAAFFWNMSNSQEFLLVAANRIACSGDKDGDGEAIAFDGNANTFAFRGTQPVAAASPDSLTVRAAVLPMQNGRVIDTANYYRGHWIQIVAGPGIGQARRIDEYVQQGTQLTMFRISPAWDIVPSRDTSRIIVGREYRQVYAIANDSDHRRPLCQKSNLTGSYGGRLSMWAPSADSSFEQNRMQDTDGIVFQQGYSADGASFQAALEIRGNVIDGEYDWSSDCSSSGITGSFAAAPTPEFPPPPLSFGTAISHNNISRADGLLGGAIDIASTWHRGPPPEDWPLVQNMLIFQNDLHDIDGPMPRATCRIGQRARIGIRLAGTGNVRDTVLYANRCDRVGKPLVDAGIRTLPICASAASNSCECGASSAQKVGVSQR